MDRGRSPPLYARHNVDEYWVIDLDARIVERTRAGEERPEILDATLEWRPAGETEPLVIDVPALFAAIYGEYGSEYTPED